MCGFCCKVLKGWCRSFTRSELLLAVLEFLLLVVLVAGVVFLVLHCLACVNKFDNDLVTTTAATISTLVTDASVKTSTSSEGKTCTWEPSKKTIAVTHYYEKKNNMDDHRFTNKKFTTANSQDLSSPNVASTIEDELPLLHYESDGEEPGSIERNSILALVKIKPPADIVFGCILTIVSKHWTLTAASCVEAIEEVDSLDSFVMLERYGEARPGRRRAVADVRVHPLYRGSDLSSDRGRDLAALRADRPFRPALRLPDPIDYLSATIGEGLIVLGFGGFRSVASGSVRAARMHVLGAWQCARGAWAARHLWAGRIGGAGAASCTGAAPLCAGVLSARGVPCHYCAGAPLLGPRGRVTAEPRGRVLLALMADNPQCGAACEPTAYVNLAALRDWIEAVIDDDN